MKGTTKTRLALFDALETGTKQQLKKHLEVHLNGFDPLKNKSLKLFFAREGDVNWEKY